MTKQWHCVHCGEKLQEKQYKELHCTNCACVYLLHTGPWLTSKNTDFGHETGHDRPFLAHIQGEPMMEPAVYEVFTWASRPLKAVPCDGCIGCFGTVKGFSKLCKDLACHESDRQDGQRIIAVEWPVATLGRDGAT